LYLIACITVPRPEIGAGFAETSNLSRARAHARSGRSSAFGDAFARQGVQKRPQTGNWPHPHQVGDGERSGGRLARADFAKRGVGVCAKTRASTESLRGRAEASTFSRARAGTGPLRRRGAGTGP